MFKKNANNNVATIGEPMVIKGYVPNGTTKMFVFKAAGKKLYASRLDCCDKTYNLRCGIATVEVAEEYEALYGPRVIILDKKIANHNSIFCRKELLALIEVENQRYCGSSVSLQSNVNPDQIIDDPRIINTQEALLGSAQLYGYKAVRSGVMDSTSIMLEGLKKPAKALHKAHKKGVVIPHVQAQACTPEEQEIIDDLFEDLSDEEIEEIIGEEVVEAQPEDADAQVEPPAPEAAPKASPAPAQPKPQQPKKNKQNKKK